MPQTATQLKHLNTVMIPVGDLDRAIEFYVDRLGFEKRIDVPYGEGARERWVEVCPPGAETTIALTPERGDWAVGRMTGISLVTDDIDVMHARLRDAGVDIDADVTRMDGPPPPMVWFRDADANVLLIVEG